jgi:hypothetical protein
MRPRSLLGALVLCCLLGAPAGAVSEQKLVDPAGAAGDHLGFAVAISGIRVVAGAPLDDDLGADVGKAIVFDFAGGSLATLYPSVAAADARFGWSVAISGDTAVVGAPFGSSAGGPGRAYVFVRSGAVWSQQAVLVPSDGAPGDRFGLSVASDGDWVVVGAWGHDGDGVDAGAAYVFSRSGTIWSQHAKLLAFDGHAMNRFGASVSISGSSVVVSSAEDAAPGFVYPYQRVGPVWLGGGKFTAADSAGWDQFGVSVSLRGSRLLAGANLHHHGVSQGAAYLFESSGGPSFAQQEEFLELPGAGVSPNVGWSVGLDADLAALGTPGGDGGVQDSGLTYVYKHANGYWAEVAELSASDGFAHQDFGSDVAADAGCVAVGAPADDDSGATSGAAYVYCGFPDPIFLIDLDVICCFVPPDYTTGPVELGLELTNHTLEDQVVVRWAELHHPDGTRETVLTPAALAVPVGRSIAEQFDLRLPAGPPPGGYGLVLHTEDANGQHTEMLGFEVNAPVPALRGGALAALAGLLVASAAWVSRRRGRRPAPS